MRTITVSPRLFGFVVATRAALAAGVALLVASRLPAEPRRAIGSTLVLIGAATTIPAVWWISRSMHRREPSLVSAGIRADRRLIGATRYARKGDDITAAAVDEIAW